MAGARHHAADVVAVDGDGRLLRAGRSEKERDAERQAGGSDRELRLSGTRHLAVLRGRKKYHGRHPKPRRFRKGK